MKRPLLSSPFFRSLTPAIGRFKSHQAQQKKKKKSVASFLLSSWACEKKKNLISAPSYETKNIISPTEQFALEMISSFHTSILFLESAASMPEA